MISPQDSLTVVPNKSDITSHAPEKGVDINLGIFGGSPNVLPPQERYDGAKIWEDLAKKPASLQTQLQPIKFDWGEEADRATQSEYYRTEGYHPYSGTVPDPYHLGKEYSYTEQHYGQIQTFGNAMRNAAGGFWNLTMATFSDSVEGTGKLFNALFNWGNDQTFKERLIGTPEELALKDEQQKAIFNKYAIFHTPERDKSVINQQFLGDIITQAGFAIGPTAEFVLEQALTMGASSLLSGFAKGTKFAGAGLRAAEMAKRAMPVAESINDGRKLGSMTANTNFFKEMVGSVKQGANWTAKQLNPLTGIEDITQAVEAGTGAWNVGITTVGAAKRMFGQANMAFNEARFEAAGTYGQMVGDLISKFEEQTGRSPEGAELDNIQKYAYSASTDNFIVNSGIIMAMNTLQFGNMFSKFSTSSKLLREALETGSDTYAVTGEIGGKAATRVYKNSGIFANPVRTFNNIRKDFGVGTALYTVGKKAISGTAAKFELFEGVQELLQTGSDNAIREYYTNLYDGRKDINGANILDANWQKAMTDQYNMDGWKTFLMGAVTGMLISPVQASVMYAAKKGYGKFNEEYKAQDDAYQKTLDDNIKLQNTFYENVNKGLNEAIKNWKIQAYASKTMEEALQSGDKYTFFNAKDDSFAATVNAAIKTNTLPALVNAIKEQTTAMSSEELADAYPALVPADGNTDGIRNTLVQVANDIEQYNNNWESLKEQYGHLVMPEIYKANKEEYRKALLAKRALDEAIELIATTDYKAKRAITRAAEIKNKIAAIQGLGQSAAEAFDILLSDARTAIKIQELSQLIAATEGIEQDKEQQQLTNSRKEQVEHLLTWNTLMQIRSTISEQNTSEDITELNDKLADAFKKYIVAHNKITGPYTDVTDTSALQGMFNEFGQYMALNRDYGHYIEALNIIADPKNFEKSYAIIRGALEYANNKLKEENIKESEKKIDAEFGVQEESEPEVVQDVDSFVDRITRGEDMSSPEDVQFYDNNKKEIEQKLAAKAKATQQSTNTVEMPAIDETIEIKLPNIQQNTPIVLNNYTAKISTINDMITIVPKDGDEDKVYDILSTVPKDQLRLGMRMEVVRNTSSVKIVEVRPNAFAVIDNRFDTPKRYPKTATDTYSRDVAEQKVAQLLGPKAFRKGEDFNPYIMQNAQEYSIKVYYEDTLLGYMREPDAHIFNFGQGPVPVQQLTDSEVQAVLEIPRNMTLTEAVRVFKDNYSTAMTFKEQLNAIMSGRDTIELVGNEIPVIPVVGEGSINVIPETEYQSRKLLSEHMKKGTELLAIYDKAQETIIYGTPDMAEEAIKVDKDDILGNYKIKVKLANGATKWLQGKGKVHTDSEIQSILDRVISDREKVIEMTKDGEVPQESDVAIANSKLESIFITTVPETGTKFYMSLAPNGKFRITRVTGKGKSATRNYLSYDTIPSTPEQLGIMLTKEIRKILAKNPAGVDPEIINTIEVKPNNLRVNIPKQVDVEYATDNIVLATGDNILRNIKLTYINDKNYQRVEQDGPSVTQVVNVDAPIQGGSTFVVPTSSVQTGGYGTVESFETSKGSVYTYNKEGKTSRFKTVENRQYPEQDITVFVKFSTPDIEQDFLQAANSIDGNKLYIIDRQGNKIDNSSQIKEDIYLAIVDNNNNVIKVTEAVKTPTIGYNVFDQRRFVENGETKREIHIGNKVSKINYNKKETTTADTGDIDLGAMFNDSMNNVPKKKGKKARKVIATEDKAAYVESIDRFREWISSNLPQISVEETEGIIERLQNGNTTVGEFVMSVLNTGRLQGTIRTSPQAAYKYHEAFHSLFRMFLPQDRIDALLAQAERESPATYSKIQAMRELHEEYAAMEESELVERYYEEYLADKFDAWMKNRNTPTSNVIKEFFNKIWNFIKEIAARITGNDISRLFYEVNRGKFKNVAVQPNQFTQDTELYTTAIAVKKVIPIGVDKETGLTRYIPQSKVESLVGNISAMFFQMSQSDGQKSKREILEEILDLYKDMYDYTKPRYRELANAITDPGARKLWYQELIDLAVLFNNEDARYSLMEAVDTNLRIYGLKQSLEEEAVEDIQEEVGDRNTDNFKKGMGTIGDISALPLKLRMYIAGTTRPFVDEYGNQQLKEEVRNEQGEVIVPAIPLREAVNPGYVYNGLLKLLSNSTTPTQLIGKLWRARKYGNNPDTTEFLDTLVRDTGLEYDEDNNTFSINREGQEILIQQVIKGFGQFEVDHMFMLAIGTDYKPELVNRKNAVDNQLKKWGPAYNDIFWRKREVVTPSDKRAYSVAAVKPIEDLIAMLKNPPEDMTVIETTAREITNGIRNNLGISIHPTYIMYSVAYYTAPDARTKDQQYMIDDYDNVDPISVEMLNTIRPILINDNLFDSKHGKTVRDVLSTMALGNSFFDETVNTISYTTADGETVYAHQLPSFYNIEIYKLNDKATIEKGKIDPYKSSSYLLYNDNFLYLSEKNKIRMISTDGIKVQNDEGNQGNVYGDFNTREAAAYDLGMYKAARSVKKGTSSFWIAPVKVRTVEAKNSAPYVELPVIGAYINGKLSTTAMNQMIAMVKSEVDRIAKVKEEIASGKDIVEGYHSGKRNKKDEGLSLPKEGEDTSAWATPPRGLYLFETAKMVGSLKADIESGNIDESGLKEQLNAYWNNEINRFAEYLFNEGLIDRGPNGEYINRLAPEYLFEGIESNGPALNLQKGNFMHNLGQVFLNNFLNSTAINTLLNGNEARLFKDSVDQVKRAAGSAGMGSSMEVVVTCPKWGITAPMTTVHHVTFKSTKGKDLFGNSIDTDDAQMYITEKALRYMLFGFGKLNQTQVDILDQLRRGDSVSAEQFYGAGGLKEKGPFNSYKLVHYDGETYIKCSAFPLFRDMVSIWRDGEWYANPEYQDLHNLLDKMEEEEQRQEAAGNNIVVFAHPDTASKAMKKNVVSGIDDIGADSFNAISASYTRLQMENPSNKVVITDPTQAKQQILAEQDDSTEVVFMGSATDSNGKPWTIGTIKKMYMGAVAQRKYNNANSAANDIFDMGDVYIELQKSIDTKAITPKLGRFLLRAQETLMATGTDSHTLGFYEVDENDNPIYNMNFPSLLPKFTELFLSYFSKGVLSEKVPGTSVALVSDRGIMKYKVVTSVWKPTDKGYIPEYAGQPKTWKVVTTKEVKADPEYYISRAKKYSNVENRTYSDIQVGDIILDTLRHNYPKYDEQGNYLGRYSEFLMPAQHAEVMKSILQAYRYMFGVRIPSDDKHSYIALEYVDTLPVQLGSVGIFPRELIRISGGDFDIDKLYIEWMDTYIEMARENQDEYDELKDMTSRIKNRLQELSEMFENTPGYSKTVADRSRKIKEQKKYIQSQYNNLSISQEDYYTTIKELDEELESLGTTEGAKERKPIIQEMNSLSKQLVGIKSRLRKLKEEAIVIPYGTKTDTQGEYDEYLRWQMANNKTLKERIYELNNLGPNSIGGDIEGNIESDIIADIEDIYEMLSATSPDKMVTKTALAELKMPTDAIEYYNKTHKNGEKIQDFNNGVQNNIALQAKLAMLSNDNISADTVVDGKTKASILNQSTSTDILKDLVKELKDTFTAIQNDSEIAESDKQGIPKVLEMLSDPIADTNSMLGQLLAFNNNKEGSRNIGAAVNSMLVYSILNSNNIELTSPIFFDGKQYTTFENHTTEDGIRKFAQISALVNAMTDNAKDPLAAKLGLNIEAVGYVAAMIAIGIPAKSAVLLMMQPSVREYFKTLKSLSGQLKTRDESKQSSFNLLADSIDSFPEGTVDKTLTTEDLEKNIVQGGTDKTLQLSALKLLSRVKDISEHIQKVANVVKLGKGLPTSFAEVDKILSTVSTLEDMENSETPPPFYITDVLLDKNSIIAADVNIASQVMKLSSTVFTERTPMFMAMLGRIDTLFRIPLGNNGDKIRKQIKDDLLSYLNIAAYMNRLRETETTGTLNTLHHGIIYDGQGIPTIYERVLQLREKLKSAKYPGNYLVDKYLYLVAAGESKSGINEVQSNQWAKLSAAVQERLGGAFMDLYANSYKDAVTEERIDTHNDAVALFHYLLVKDGGQIKSNSFVKYIPNEVFKELLTSAGDVNKAINNGTGDALEEVFGPEWDKLLSTFMESYAEHVGSDTILRSFYPMQETAEGSVVRGGIGIEGNNIIIDTPGYIYSKGYKSFANLGIDSKNKMTMFPLYMKMQIEGTKSNGEPYTYYDILKLVELTTDGRPYTPNYNNPINNAHRAVYIRVPARGSYAQWKGAGVYGKTPLRGTAGSYTPADNPLYTVSSPVQQISAPEQPEITPEPQPTTWQEYLLNKGLVVSMMRGAHGTVFMVQDTNKENSRPVSIHEYSSGNANTPEELYEYLAGNRIASQPAVFSQSMSIPLYNNYSRQSVVSDPEYIYLFTDNATRSSGRNPIDLSSWYVKKYGQGNYPGMTQAVIRGLDNAYPITTMIDDKRTQWDDSKLKQYKQIIDSEIQDIKVALQSGKYKGVKFAAQMPFGKGQISNMKLAAPKVWEYMNSKLREIGIENSGNQPTIITPSQPMEPTTRVVASIPQNKVSGVASYGSLVEANDEAKKLLGPNPHSIDMIAAGIRTRTTRSESEMSKYRVRVGDIVKQFGKSADGLTKEILTRVTAIHPKGTSGWKETWDKEGWRPQDVNAIDRFKDGAAAIEFELLEPTVQQPTVSAIPQIELGRYVQYQGSTYIVTKQNSNGTWQIYDPTKEGTAAKKSVADKNLTPTSNKGSIVTYKDKEYIVTPKGTIISLTTNKKMEWGPENGDRRAILELAKSQGTDVDFIQFIKGKLDGSKMSNEIQGELRTNKDQLIALLGNTMYNAQLKEVVYKELLQNAFDATKIAIAKGDIRKGDVKIATDFRNRTISFTDNGVGMTPDIVQKAFFTIGGTYKGEGVSNTLKSGGLGLAKMAFIFGSERLDLKTVHNGIETTVNATSDEIRSDNFTIKTRPTNEKNGTTVTVTLPKSYVNSNGEERIIDFPEYIDIETQYGFLSKPLIGNIDIELSITNKRGEVVTKKLSGNPPEGYEKFTTAYTNWGDIDIYVDTRNVGKEYGNKHEILSSGLYQFETRFKKLSGNDEIPLNMIIDIKPKVVTTNEQYPFNNQRENFRSTVLEDVNKLQHYVGLLWKIIETKMLQSSFGKMKNINPVSLETPDQNIIEQNKRITESLKVPSIESIIKDSVEEFISTEGDGTITDKGITTSKRTITTQEIKENEEKRYSSSFKAEKELKLEESTVKHNLDPYKPVVHNNTNMEINNAGMKYISEISSFMVDYKKAIIETYGEDYSPTIKDQLWGVSIDKTYGGVNVSPEMVNFLAINPFYFVPENNKVKDIVTYLAVAIDHLITHELNHNFVRSEGAEFTGRFPTTQAEMQSMPGYFELRAKLTKIVANNIETIKKLHNDYTSSKNVDSAFEANKITKDNEGSRDRRIESLPSDDTKDNDRPTEDDTRGNNRSGESLGEILRTKSTYISTIPKQEVKQMTGEQWKEQLSAIYSSQKRTIDQRSWTIDKLAYRDGRRNAGIPDTTILEEIKAC